MLNSDFGVVAAPAGHPLPPSLLPHRLYMKRIKKLIHVYFCVHIYMCARANLSQSFQWPEQDCAPG